MRIETCTIGYLIKQLSASEARIATGAGSTRLQFHQESNFWQRNKFWSPLQL